MRAGLAGTTITPDRRVYMAGYAARTEPSEGAYNDLEAAAMVLDNEGARLAVLAVDLVGVDEFILDPVRARAAELGIPAEKLLVNVSHTHCGPACRKVRGSCQGFDDEYLWHVIAKLGGLLSAAVDDLQDARLDYTVGSCTLGVNRRHPAGMLPAPAKPVDTDVPVLRVLGPDGGVRAVAFSYACHPTTMGGQLIGTDYPGPARDVVREKLPGCLPIFLQGCGGDVKPRNVTGDGTFASGPIEAVYEIGHELGRAVLTALCGERTPLGDTLAGARDVAELPTRGQPAEEELGEMEAGNQWERMWAEAARQTIAEKGALAEVLPVEVQALRVGDLIVLGLGGEVSCEIGLELKARLPGRHVLTLGYSNLLRCYVASRDAHKEGGYEVRDSFVYSLTPEPRPLGLAPESVDVLVDRAIGAANAV